MQKDHKKPEVSRLLNGEKRYDLFCDICGTSIEGKTPKRKYCDECGDKRRKELVQLYNKSSKRSKRSESL